MTIGDVDETIQAGLRKATKQVTEERSTKQRTQDAGESTREVVTATIISPPKTRPTNTRQRKGSAQQTAVGDKTEEQGLDWSQLNAESVEMVAVNETEAQELGDMVAVNETEAQELGEPTQEQQVEGRTTPGRRSSRRRQPGGAAEEVPQEDQLMIVWSENIAATCRLVGGGVS